MIERKPLRVRIKRIDKDIPLPRYETDGAVCFDLRSRERVVFPPHEIRKVPLNIIVEVPQGYKMDVTPRSSTQLKKGLAILSGLGIVDQDYCGDEDEAILPLWNFTSEEVVVEKGERLVQAGFVRVDKAEWVEVEEMGRPSRGGFGSTGED